MAERPVTGTSRDYLRSGVRVVLLGRGLGRVLRLVLQVVVARLLGPDDFGAFIVAWSSILIVQKSVLLGADRLGIRFGGILLDTGDRRERARFVASVLGVAALLGILAGIAIAAGASLVVRVLDLGDTGRLVTLLALGLPILTIHLTLTGLVRGAHRPGSEALWSEIVTPALGIGALFALPELIPDRPAIELVALAFLLSHAPPAFGMALRVARDYLRREPEDSRRSRVLPPTREVARFALGVSGVGILTVLMARVDRVLVSPFLDATAVGLYASAALVAQQNAFFLQSVVMTAGPRFALLERRGQRGELRDSAGVVERWTALLSMPVVLLTIFLAPDLLGLMGPEFRAGWPLLVILSTVQGVNVTTGTSGALLNMTGNERLNLRALGVGLTLLAVLVPAGSILFGVEGATAGTGLAWVAVWVLQRRSMARRLDVPFPAFRPADVALPTAAAVVVGTLVTSMVRAGVLRPALVILLLPAAYGAVVWSLSRREA